MSNTALAVGIIGTLLESALRWQALTAKAQAEGRDISDDELDALRAGSQSLVDQLNSD